MKKLKRKQNSILFSEVRMSHCGTSCIFRGCFEVTRISNVFLRRLHGNTSDLWAAQKFYWDCLSLGVLGDKAQQIILSSPTMCEQRPCISHCNSLEYQSRESLTFWEFSQTTICTLRLDQGLENDRLNPSLTYFMRSILDQAVLLSCLWLFT